MLTEYRKHAAEREALGVPPLPLDADQTRAVCEGLLNPPPGEGEFLRGLLRDRVPPGVDPAARVKAEFLAAVLEGRAASPLVSRIEAVRMLGAMLGGYNVAPLVRALRDSPGDGGGGGAGDEVTDEVVRALAGLTQVYDAFDEVATLAKERPSARRVLDAWAAGAWFTSRPALPATLPVTVFKVDGETNTDDLSPAGDAATRPDIPLHALAMGRTRFPGGIQAIADLRAQGRRVAFVGDVVGTGSSRKSATNSVLWHIGEDIPGVPNKRRGGVVIGGVIAPIFFNTVEDSGGLPLTMDVTRMKTGDDVILDFERGEARTPDGEVLATFALKPATLRDEFRAGGRIPLIIGRSLTDKARQALGLGPTDLFTRPDNPKPRPGQGYTLAQKMVGRACGVDGVLPGTACEPRMTTVGSQDTTGPMTADELKELACLRFQAPLFMQSFCHTAAYPKPADVRMHDTLPGFVTERGGVALNPGDGVIHSWINRMVLPDTLGTGGDSHTRFPIGLSFPAGSGLVAFAGALGFMPLDMPESVLVRFSGRLKPGITLRDVVNAIPLWAIRRGLLTVPKKNKVNVFNGRVLEMEGLRDLTVEQAFELTDASAERSAAGATIALSIESVATFLRSNVALLRRMCDDGYQDADTLRRRVADMEAWLASPTLLRRDDHAEYAAVIEMDLAEITEPILACPNDPDDVKPLSEVAGTPVHDVFIGSCMTNIGHFRAAAEIWRGATFNPAVRVWLCPPTRMDQAQLKREGLYPVFAGVGARVEIPGCSLCMGNQARVPDGVTVFSTSTRNFDHRMGTDARVFLGSAEVGAVAALLGRLPTPQEYFDRVRERVTPRADQTYRYLQFDEIYR